MRKSTIVYMALMLFGIALSAASPVNSNAAALCGFLSGSSLTLACVIAWIYKE